MFKKSKILYSQILKPFKNKKNQQESSPTEVEGEEEMVTEEIFLINPFSNDNNSKVNFQLSYIDDNNEFFETGYDEKTNKYQRTQIDKIFNRDYVSANNKNKKSSQNQNTNIVNEQDSQDADLEIDKLVLKFEMMGNQLNTIKIRTSSIYDKQQQQHQQQVQEYLSLIDQLNISWVQNPKLIQESQKTKFLNETPQIAKVLGIQKTIEHLIPCLVECFNSDEFIHPDLYDQYANILFRNADQLIIYLGTEGGRKNISKFDEIFKNNELNDCKSETSSISSNNSANLAVYSHEFNFQDPLERVGLKSGYQGLTNLIKQIYAPFFESERYEDSLRNQVIDNVISQLVQISNFISIDDREKLILPIIEESLKDQNDDERRLIAIRLIDELAESLGKQICLEKIMYDFISLQDDPIFKIRREIALRIKRFSQVVGDKIFVGVILPVLRKLSQDSIWSVRKACVEILPEISKISNQEIRTTQITQLFKHFLLDSSKWVKITTFQIFGPLIFTFENQDINQNILDYFISMGKSVEQGYNQNQVQNVSQIDNDTIFYCAFNFPAVLQTLGPEFWQNKLKPMHDLMVTDQRWKVRRSLAYSIHECAQILGPKITEEDLMPVLFHLLQDIADVSEGILENLPSILKILKIEQRDKYIELFVEAQNKAEKQNQNKWRQREQFALQIRDFSSLISSEKLSQYYLPKFYDMCLDDVAQVRETASRETTVSIIKNFILSNNKLYIDGLLQEMNFFKKSNIFLHRQTFIGMIHSILIDFCQIQQFKSDNTNNINLVDLIVLKHFKNDLIDLSKDRVVGVRIYLSEMFLYLQKQYDLLEIEYIKYQRQLNERQPSKINVQECQYYIKEFEKLKDQIENYLNNDFYECLYNLKNDPLDCVNENLRNIEVQEGKIQGKNQSDKIEIIERDILLRCQSVNIEQLKNKNNMLLDSALDEKVISIEDFNENINKKLKQISEEEVSDTASSDLLNFEMLEDMKRNCSIENESSKFESIADNIEEIK